MRFTLKDYQDEAVLEVLTNLRKAARRWHEDDDLHAFSLSATTGAGKTVMAAATFEALFHGDDSYDVEPDPGAVVLWFSDDPSLNEQTRFRLHEASDRLDHLSDLVVVHNAFNEETFSPGKVYFLNTQKLGRNSLLTRGHDAYEEAAAQGQNTLPEMRPDARSFTIWDTIRNTIEHPDLTLYLVLDEAHRGMGSSGKAARDARSTIVKRLINGDGTVPPVPIVWGISATVDRFRAAMADADGRSTLPDVEVDTTRVQESGLLKDTIVLDIPDEAGQFDTVLVRRGTKKLREATAAWADYADTQGAEPVVPLMVLQVPNKPDPGDVGQALATVYETWPDLPGDAVAHVLGDHTAQTFGDFTVPYIAPERVQESAWVRVLIAKDAISTGWDCPRAEVMVSFRPAKDRTHITQLLGRMVRTPLARRIPGDERLNAVDCLLPFFDTRNVTAVADALMHGAGDAGGDSAPVRRVLVNPIEVTPNPAVPQAVWDTLLALPSQSLPQRTAKPVKRLTALAHELAADGLLPDAGKTAHAEMHRVLDAAQARYRDEIAEARASVLTLEGKTLTADLRTREATFDDFVAAADHVVIEDAYRRAARMLSPDVARTYAEHLADRDREADSVEDALLDAHATVAALGLVPEVRDYLDDEADALAKTWFTEHRASIKSLGDDRQDAYRQLREMSVEPQDLDLAKPTAWLVPTMERHGDKDTPLPTYDRHLLAGDDGTFPMYANAWETEVLERERGRPGFAGWYRNPSRSSQDSLTIAYEDGPRYRTLRPDFVIFSDRPGGGIAASIVDPHGHHLADALPKLRGLAAYAAAHGQHYQRIDAVTKVDDTYRVLDLTEPDAREAVAAATDATTLYRSEIATDY